MMTMVNLRKLQRAIFAIEDFINKHAELNLDVVAKNKQLLDAKAADFGSRVYATIKLEAKGDFDAAIAGIREQYDMFSASLDYRYATMATAAAEANVTAARYNHGDGLLLLMDTPVRRHAQRIMRAAGGETNIQKAADIIDKKVPDSFKLKLEEERIARKIATQEKFLESEAEQIRAQLDLAPPAEEVRTLQEKLEDIQQLTANLFSAQAKIHQYTGLVHLRALVMRGEEGGSRRKRRATRRIRKSYDRLLPTYEALKEEYGQEVAVQEEVGGLATTVH